MVKETCLYLYHCQKVKQLLNIHKFTVFWDKKIQRRKKLLRQLHVTNLQICLDCTIRATGKSSDRYCSYFGYILCNSQQMKIRARRMSYLEYVFLKNIPQYPHFGPNPNPFFLFNCVLCWTIWSLSEAILMSLRYFSNHLKFDSCFWSPVRRLTDVATEELNM